MPNAFDELALGIGKGVLAAAGVTAAAVAAVGVGKAVVKAATGPAAQTGIGLYTATQANRGNKSLDEIKAQTAAIPSMAQSADSSVALSRAMAEDLHAMAIMQGARLPTNARFPGGFGIPEPIRSDSALAAEEAYRRTMMSGMAKQHNSSQPVIWGR